MEILLLLLVCTAGVLWALLLRTYYHRLRKEARKR
jgi:hypothetical protein